MFHGKIVRGFWKQSGGSWGRKGGEGKLSGGGGKGEDSGGGFVQSQRMAEMPPYFQNFISGQITSG